LEIGGDRSFYVRHSCGCQFAASELKLLISAILAANSFRISTLRAVRHKPFVLTIELIFFPELDETSSRAESVLDQCQNLKPANEDSKQGLGLRPYLGSTAQIP
jgi:hypothetical protein